MGTPSPSRIAEPFDPVGLEELQANAALLDRVDRKYLVPLETLAALVPRLTSSHRALELGGVRALRYRTAYYDTPELDAYRDHVQRRRRRYKCRSRRYEDSGGCAFELKLEGLRGRTVKHRMPYDERLHGSISTQARDFLRERLLDAYGREPSDQLTPLLEVTYRRLTLVDLERGERLTCDFDVAFAGGGRLRERAAIVESKSAGPATPADRALLALGFRPVEACSKYCIGIGLTRSDVRTNPFRRLLDRWFTA